MALELDARQRAMLQDMGVTVWLPAACFITTSSIGRSTHLSTMP